jgi:hypothetical protein
VLALPAPLLVLLPLLLVLPPLLLLPLLLLLLVLLLLVLLLPLVAPDDAPPVATTGTEPLPQAARTLPSRDIVIK